ncbi:potassium-transporting ATPase subunit KdpA [Dankookia rubra]|nr:potassium-transporting ATPase subunit KdpA [Dankookia rubra]
MSIERLAWALNNLNEVFLGIMLLLGSFLPILIFVAIAQRKRRIR